MKTKHIIKYLSLFALLAFLTTACDLVDITEVENPQITEEKLFEDATGGAAPLVTGLEFAFSDAVNRSIVYTEVVSDNYDNVSTFIPTTIDLPRLIRPSGQWMDDEREIYFKLQTLHSLAIFGVDIVLPADEEAGDQDWATTYFYKGMALLMLSENFAAFPIAENGEMVRAEDALNVAINNLTAAKGYNVGGEFDMMCSAALARAYRLAGDKVNAAAHASTIAGSSFLFSAKCDAVYLTNRPNLFTIRRNTLNDMQPLPRLDFLDPKYTELDTPIPVLKAEESYLILAEIELANGSLAGAKSEMINAINLAASRSAGVEFADNDPRDNRPSDPSYTVKAAAHKDARAGLIQARGGEVTQQYAVSRTSVTEEMINNAVSLEDGYYLLYLLRQEIFFLEGRRMSDLGIRLPVMERQINANANVNAGMYGTEVIVPSYIPADDEMDDFTIDDANGVVTCAHDMNQVLVNNIGEVSPF